MSKNKVYPVLFALALSVTVVHASVWSDGFRGTGSLEKSGDEVFVSYELSVSPDAASSCRTIYLTPQLLGGGESVSFPPVVIKGKDRNRAYERWVSLHGKDGLPRVHAELRGDLKTSQEVDFSTVVPYEPWMDGAEFRLEERMFYCGSEEGRSYHFLSRLDSVPLPPPVLVYEPIGEETRITEEEFVMPLDCKEKEGVAYIAFEQGKSIIRLLYGDNRDELRAIGEVIRSVEEDETAEVVGLMLTGYASPEGSELTNYRLSKKRTEAVMNYLNETFALKLSRKQMKVSARGEDWEGLRRLLADEYIPYHREVMKIIDADMNADEKEHRLQAIAGGELYRILLEDYFPLLRRTEYRILYKVRE